MGQPKGQKHGARSKIKKYKRGRWLCHRTIDPDQVHEMVAKLTEEKGKTHQSQPDMTDQQPQKLPPPVQDDVVSKPPPMPFDDELPGGGQFYCIVTGKHFIDARALSLHQKSRFYKRRLKELKEESKYTQQDADFGAGMTREKLPPAHGKK
jgi:bud site selection protein 20